MIPKQGIVLPPSQAEQRRSPPTTSGRSASTAAASGTEHMLCWSVGLEVSAISQGFPLESDYDDRFSNSSDLLRAFATLLHAHSHRKPCKHT